MGKLMDVPGELVEQMRRDNVVLFVGMGLSQLAGLPGWEDLGARLAERIDYTIRAERTAREETTTKIAQFYENTLGRNSLISYIRDAFDTTGIEPTRAHRLIAGLPFQTVFCTCYDDLLQLALKNAGRKTNMIVSRYDVAVSDPRKVNLVKLSGDLNRPESIVVTQGDFETSFARRSLVHELMLTRVALATPLFLGYSLEDSDFNLLANFLDAEFGSHRRPSYVVAPRADRLVIEELRSRNYVVIEIPGEERTPIPSLEFWLESLTDEIDKVPEDIDPFQKTPFARRAELDYERGFERLRAILQGHDLDAELELRTLEERWLENVRAERMFGTSESSRSTRNRIVYALNELSLANSSLSFFDLAAADAESLPHDLRSRLRFVDREPILRRLARSPDESQRLDAVRQIVALVAEMKERDADFTAALGLLNQLREDPSSKVRREYLRALQANYNQIPSELRETVASFATAKEPEIRSDLAAWITDQFDTVGHEYEPLLLQLVNDYDMNVRRSVLTVIRARIDALPRRIAKLALEISLPVEVTTIQGSAMLMDRSNDLVLRIKNTSQYRQIPIEVEIIEPSAEYQVNSSNPVSTANLAPSHSTDFHFSMQVKVAKEIAVNYRVNGQLMEPPLYINAIKDNPYVYGDPVREERAFVGRKDELEQIVQAVTKPTKQDILIIGERRTGKTSLLYQLGKRLGQPLFPVYIVLNMSAPRTNHVLAFIVREIAQSLHEQGILAENRWRNYDVSHQHFVRALKEIIDAAKQQLSDFKLVLLLDEADYMLKVRPERFGVLDSVVYLARSVTSLLTKKPLVDDLLQNVLRAALQSKEVGAELRAVAAGTNDLSTYVSERTSPFFNHFRFVPLRLLTRTETEALITKPARSLGYHYSQESIERLIALSGGHPYYCQALCYEAFGAALKAEKGRIEIVDVSSAEDKVKEDLFNAFLSGFWSRCSRREKEFLRALAQGKPIGERTHAQVSRLLKWQLIVEREGEYAFSAGLLRDWTLMAIKEIG